MLIAQIQNPVVTCFTGIPSDLPRLRNSIASTGWCTASARAIADIPALFGNLATLKQIHSADCVPADGRAGMLGRRRRPARGFARLASWPSRPPTAFRFCSSIRGRRAVAAVHAGWRGTAARHRRARGRRHGTRNSAPVPHDLHAAIGPGIGECCYEVGPEVADRFGEQGRAQIDLSGINRRQLDRGRCNAPSDLRVEFVHHVPRRGVPFLPADKEAAGRLYSFIGILAEPRLSGTVKLRRLHVHVDLPAMRARSSSCLYRCPDCSNKEAAACPAAARGRWRSRLSRNTPPPQQPYVAASSAAGSSVAGPCRRSTKPPPCSAPLAEAAHLASHAWLFAFAFLGLGAGVLLADRLAQRQRTAAVHPSKAPPPRPAPRLSPLQKYIEVAGVRFIENAKKKTEVKFVITNHSRRRDHRPGRQCHHLGPYADIRRGCRRHVHVQHQSRPVRIQGPVRAAQYQAQDLRSARLAERQHRYSDHPRPQLIQQVLAGLLQVGIDLRARVRNPPAPRRSGRSPPTRRRDY